MESAAKPAKVESAAKPAKVESAAKPAAKDDKKRKRSHEDMTAAASKPNEDQIMKEESGEKESKK